MNPAAKERLSKVKAIYFDLDDTLCGYWDASKKGLREAFELNPIPGVTTDEAVAAWGGAFRGFASDLKKIPHLYDAYLSSGSVTRKHQMELTLESLGQADEAFAERLSEAYMTRRDANLKLFPDAIDVLEQLSKHYKIGLITNGPADIQNQEIDTTGIRRFLQAIFIEGEQRIGKPEREVFDRAAAAMDCTPEELLMVGNSLHHDIMPAIEHGWATVWTLRDTDVPPSSKTGKPEPIPTEGPLPDLIVSHLSEILPYLEK